MEGKVIAVVVVAGIVGLTAIVLSFVGEATRIKVDEVVYSTDDDLCYYPESPSMALGIVAAILLLIEQIVISVGTGCFCCRKTPCTSNCGGICAIVCFVFSWLSFVSAFVMLIIAGVMNNMYYLVNNYTSDDNLCPVAKPGFFIIAGVLCLFSVGFSFASYTILMCTDKKNHVRQQANQHGVAMGQPQLPKDQV